MKTHEQLVSEIVEYLRERAQFAIVDVENIYCPQTEAERIQVKIAVNEARNALVADGIVFGPVRKFAGHYRRLETPGQVEAQADRQRIAGRRKLDRSNTKLSAAAMTSSDAKERERLEAKASRYQLAALLAKKRTALGSEAE